MFHRLPKDILIDTLDKYKKKTATPNTPINTINTSPNQNYQPAVYTPSSDKTITQLSNSNNTPIVTTLNPTPTRTSNNISTNTSLSMEQKDALVGAGLMKQYVDKNKGWNDLSQDEVKSLLSQLGTNKSASNNQTPANPTADKGFNISSENDAFQTLLTQMQESFKPVDYKQVYSDIMGMLPKQEETKTLSWDEALERAKSTLDPIYDQRMSSLVKSLDVGNLSRGFYGQLPGEALKLENMTNEEGARLSALSQFANDLVGKSEADARNKEAMNMQRESQRIGILQNALDYEASSKQANISNLSNLVGMYNQMDKDEWQRKVDELLIGWQKEDRDWLTSSRLTDKDRQDMIWNWQVEDRDRNLTIEEEDREYEKSLRDIVLDMKKLEQSIAANADYGEKKKAETEMKILQEELRKAKAWKISSTGSSSSSAKSNTYNDTLVGIYSTIYSMNPQRAYADLQNQNSSLRKQILSELSSIGHKDPMNFLHELEADVYALTNGSSSDPNYYNETNYDKYIHPDY